MGFSFDVVDDVAYCSFTSVWAWQTLVLKVWARGGLCNAKFGCKHFQPGILTVTVRGSTLVVTSEDADSDD